MGHVIENQVEVRNKGRLNLTRRRSTGKLIQKLAGKFKEVCMVGCAESGKGNSW